MKFAIVQFPGSNCDQDCLAALRGIEGIEAEYVWHKETSLGDADAIVLPGGFSYGDYLRCGAIARFSPIMRAVIEEARAGKLVIGICNGFQILCEAGLLPGALVRNRSLHFVCAYVHDAGRDDRLTFPPRHLLSGRFLQIPIAHGEGCYFADEETLRELNERQQVLLRYCDADGQGHPRREPKWLGGKHRRHLQSRAQRLRPDAAPGPRLRDPARQPGRRENFPVDARFVRRDRSCRVSIFVTGTDTGVGKTSFTVWLLERLARGRSPRRGLQADLLRRSAGRRTAARSERFRPDD